MPCMKVKIYFISAAAALLAIVALVFVLRHNAAYYCQRASKELAKGDIDNALVNYDTTTATTNSGYKQTTFASSAAVV